MAPHNRPSHRRSVNFASSTALSGKYVLICGTPLPLLSSLSLVMSELCIVVSLVGKYVLIRGNPTIVPVIGNVRTRANIHVPPLLLSRAWTSSWPPIKVVIIHHADGYAVITNYTMELFPK